MVKKQTIRKGEIIQRKGDQKHYLYFVESGMLRSYAIDKHDRENIFMFAPEGWTIADNNGPEVEAQLFIDAVEDSVVQVIEKDISKEGKNIGKIVKRLAVLQERVIMLMSSSAIERYEHFIATYPDIVQRVPQKMIASYLGVTQETLSAAKSQWLKKRKAGN